MRYFWCYAWLLIFQFSFGQQKLPVENFRIFPSSVAQTEPMVAVSPLDSNLLFASAFTISSGFKSEGIYVSTDGGLNWRGTDTMTAVSIDNHGGDPGVVIDKNGHFIQTHVGWLFQGVYSHRSTDQGISWSAAATVTSAQPEDKGTTTTDNSPASPYYGRIYTTWVNYAVPYPVMISYSTNGGINWSAPARVINQPPTPCSGGFIRTDKLGNAYIVWSGVTSTSNFTEDYIGFAKSTNGGLNWTSAANICDMNGVTGPLPQKSGILINSLPSMDIDNYTDPQNPYIYIVTTEKNLAPAGSDPDIILHRSVDGGTTWSPGIRVNQDAKNNGKIQYFPAIAVDNSGAVNIIYYDDRNTAADSAEIILARSTDHGDTWNEWVISNHRFKPKPIVGSGSGRQGDRISLLARGQKLHAFWMDDFSGLYQVWSCIIDRTLTGVEQRTTSSRRDFEVLQNYPNPFNPATTITIRLNQASALRMQVYNSLGQQVACLMDGFLTKGQHQVTFDASALPGGIYFCRVETATAQEIIKLVYLK